MKKSTIEKRTQSTLYAELVNKIDTAITSITIDEYKRLLRETAEEIKAMKQNERLDRYRIRS